MLNYKAPTHCKRKPPPNRHFEFCRVSSFTPKLLLSVSDWQICGKMLNHENYYSLTILLTLNFDLDLWKVNNIGVGDGGAPHKKIGKNIFRAIIM